MTTNSTTFDAMNSVLGANYQFVTDVGSDPIVLAKLPDEDLRSIPDATREEYNLTPENFVRRSLAPKNSVVDSEPTNLPTTTATKPREKTTDDYLFQFYLGSLTVVGLFVLFRMIQKSH